MANSSIVVMGSLNMDFVLRMPRLPAAGETVLGSHFEMVPGGKGANQSCAAGKLSNKPGAVRMVGKVGYDVFADHLKASLSAAGVDVSFVHATKSQPTGVASIWVDESGQNSIVVASGANGALLPQEVGAYRPVFEGAAYVLFQLETPLVTVEAALRMAREVGAKTILDPAPAQPLSREILALTDILTPNETEACLLLGRPVSRLARDEVAEVASALRAAGTRAVVLKLGDQGCFYADGATEHFVAGFRVTPVDSTAAGDVFNAALAVALTENKAVPEALQFANAAAALSVTRHGAQPSVPARSEVDAFLKSCAS